AHGLQSSGPESFHGLRRLLVLGPTVYLRPLGRPARAPEAVRLQLRPAAARSPRAMVRVASRPQAEGEGEAEAAGAPGCCRPREMRRTAMKTLTKRLLAGTAGTAAMTALQEISIYLRRQGTVGMKHEEKADNVAPWSRAPAPAQLLQRAVTKATGVEPDPTAIPLYTNVMHWGYGIGVGVAYALASKR